MEEKDKDSTVKETVINCLEAPKLKGVSTGDFIEFKRLRELYEKQIEEKNRHLQSEIIPTSYRASIEDDDLKIFIAAGWIRCSSVDELTERQIQECVEERCKREVTGEQLYLVDQAVKTVAIRMSIVEAEDRIWSLRREYSNALRVAGYQEVMESKPHIAITHVLKKLKPHQLYLRMLDIMKWRKDENFHKENFDRFMREVAKQAKKIQTEQRIVPFQEKRVEKETVSTAKKAFHPVRRMQPRPGSIHPLPQPRKERTETDLRGTKRKRDTYEAPLCLNPECRSKGRRHYISNCDVSDKGTKTALLEQYRKSKKARYDDSRKDTGRIGRIAYTPSSPHSSIFKASFAKGQVAVDLMTDQGADANFISEKLLSQIEQIIHDVKRKPLEPHQIYRGITGDPCLNCYVTVKLDVFLQIRHGTSLVLRNIIWKVAREDIRTPIIGRRVLESLGCDNREMLMAAKHKFGDEIDVTKRLVEDGNEECENTIAALYGESVFHNGGQIEDDGLEENDVYIDLGEDAEKDVEKELAERINEAKTKGLSEEGTIRLEKIIQKHKSIFRIRLGNGGPAHVPPMRITLDPTKQPIKVKVRKYPADHRKFLDAYFDKLVKMGFLKVCPQASWQAAPHLVPKDSKTKFRTTIDLRPVNAATKAEQWPMPLIEAELSDFMGCTHFASLDFCSSYWQCPLDPESYDACGIIAPQGTFVSTRVLHGLKNASAYFQSTIPPLFDKIKNAMKAWIDDFTIHTTSEPKLLDYLDEFFTICEKHNLYLSAKKSVFYTQQVKWCGRIIDSSGYQLDPRNMEAVRNMEEPLTASELCQFIHCCRWMSNCIPDFHRRIQPLNDVLEKAYEQAGKRKKTALKNIMLHKLSWGTEHKAALASIQNSLQNAVKLAFQKPDHVVCVYTDASEELWAAVVTQTKEENLSKPTIQQQHEPLAFLGGKFNGAQRNWTTYEKEAYAVVQTFERMDYLLWGAKQTHVFTDHRNLLYVFAPLALRPNSPRHVLSKVHRWAIHLSRFEFHINHIEGSNNVFADILTRWSKGYRSVKAQTKLIAALYGDIMPSSTEMKSVSVEEVRREQRKHSPPGDAVRNEEGIYLMKGKIWIPSIATDLKLRIAVEAHCGERGHRAFAATLDTISSEYWWPEMKQDTREFTQSCIHCIVSRNGERIPRPLASALHGEKPNEVIHADFLYMGPSEESDLKYVLIVKDDLSSYTWLCPCNSADSEAATNILAKWIACFGGMDWLVTDQGSHFKASLMNNLTTEMRIRHHFTTAYCPWSNGTVERVCKETLRIIRALLSEWRLSVGQWPSLLNAVQKIINQSPVERLGTNEEGKLRCPMEVFIGLKPSPLVIRPLPLRRYRDLNSLSEERCKQILNFGTLHEALDQMQKEINMRNQHRRKQAQRIHNAKTNVSPLNIEVGDYVMVRTHCKRNHKLQTNWRGPMRVTEAKSSLVFVVEDIVNANKMVVHAQRMLPYPVSQQGELASAELVKQAEHYDTAYHLVDSIRGIRKKGSEYEVLVKWLGFERGNDETWEALSSVKEDMPGTLEDYLHTAGDRNIKREVIDLYF